MRSKAIEEAKQSTIGDRSRAIRMKGCAKNEEGIKPPNVYVDDVELGKNVTQKQLEWLWPRSWGK